MKSILGTMGVGGTLNLEHTTEVLKHWKRAGFSEIDTALMYQSGKSEQILGDLAASSSFSIATKANPWFDIITNKTTMNQSNGFSTEPLSQQLKQSLQTLKTNKVNLFYLHAPDHNTPLLETLTTIRKLQEQNLFDEWGLSNYPSWQVVHIYHLCKANKISPPTVYQGMYNCITRDVEKELFPALKLCGMRFYAYNPLAGGMLTGKYKPIDDPDSGRFSSKTVWGEKYRQRFWKKEIFDAFQLIESCGQKYNITLIQICLSWLYYHSQLSANKGDGIIIGGSTVEQITTNIDTVKQLKPLPDEVLTQIEEAWKLAAPVCEQYWR
jgi:aflatoxin B1 aldehyde reductase